MAKQTVAFVSYGQGGALVNTVLSAGDGILKLSNRIQALGVGTPGPFSWSAYQVIADQIKKLPADVKVIVGGASLGANMAPWIASAVGGRKIDLIFGIQPSLYGGRYPITNNVMRALCIYNPNWLLTLGFGGYQWQREESNRTTVLTTLTTYAPHPGDNLESTQAPILREISKVVES